MPNYGDFRYWDDRYTQQKNTTFDWLENWNDLKDMTQVNAIEGMYTTAGNLQSDAVLNKIKSNLKILNLGCGNSIYCEDMYDDGFSEIYNMDISSVCIEQMLKRNQKCRPEMKWEVMDVRDLTY